ncbi:lysophospholipid acyltransferase family protein [Streptomyces sp. NPDC046977]|uniref:lysophospholipid acyltransferase family protein n=1 Tax=Streptomyces sp. NPDC046977 TaxID=3154703 RepID=UPI0033C24CBF
MAELVYPPVIGFARTMFRVQGLRFDISGTEHVPRNGGALLVSNHIGYLDFVFAGLTALPAKRLVRFMAKESVFRHKVSGPLMRAMKHIPVDRSEGMHAYKHALSALRSGEIIGVFPEATISQSFTLKSFKSGAARLAIEAGVPLLPVALWGTQRMWTKGQPRQLGRNRFPISIRVGEQMEAGENEKPGALTRRLRLRIQELLEDAQRAYTGRPSGPDDHWWLPAHLGGTAPTPEAVAAQERTAAEG